MKRFRRFPEHVPILHREGPSFSLILHREKPLFSLRRYTLVYGDEAGKIRLGCFFGAAEWDTFDLGLVPDEIASLGAKAVRAFGWQKMEELCISLDENEKERNKRMDELNAVYEIEANGVTIKGFVQMHEVKPEETPPNVGREKQKLRLVMTEPFQLEGFLPIRPSCWAEAMMQRKTFDEDGFLHPDEVERHKRALVRFYEEEQLRRTKPPEHPTLKALTETK